ncbi:MAG: tRNA (adenosine(37)-N6)-threonylcarbamoyltransferase complex dimerization subunit type 1 TsaB [Oscillospiraceae bacterium]|jgi:tRNA threonylcarbamoyladenosine biosynthesis protein TsaB|nr:tRNA (adenosine(37)-N6)-threonylcarbamoyltransferase complex dimerization subunit type 1 TsaB [Oscillospiraceae bacterium]
MLIFALESSAKAASVAITRDGALIGEQFLNVGLTHSQTLMPMTQALFAQTGLTPADMDFFAVAVGPGSFTGVRIGVSQTKGMAMAANRPCIPVSSLEAMCFSFCPASGAIICPVMDARCGQVYNALFEAKDGVFLRLCEDRAIAVDELCGELAERKKQMITKHNHSAFVLVGDGAQPMFARCGLREGSNSAFRIPYSELKPLLAPPSVRFQRASGVALAAESAPLKAVTAAELVPVYLRLPQAERELRAKTAKES